MTAIEGQRSGARLAWYGAAVFLSSGGLMALEIAAGRLLAPYIGVSLYSWTAIIGVVLGGLSLGNWAGGVWADRGGAEAAVGWTLGAGAVACIAILLLLTVVAPPLQRSGLGLLSVSFLFVAALFLLPAVLLGVVTPLLTTLALGLDARTGHVVGRMHALAALGSIAGTFLTGYVLIQTLGTRSVIIGTGAMLGTMTLPFLWGAWRSLGSLALVMGICLGGTASRGGFLDPCDQETSYFCIRIVDMTQEAPFGHARGLVLDHLLHGISHEEQPTLLIAPYTHLMDELINLQLSAIQVRSPAVFFAGGGAYTQPRALQARYPSAQLTVAELDPEVTRAAREHLFLDPGGMRIVHSDARRVLASMPAGRFDAIVGDVFHDIAVPFHLVTLEYARLVKSRLRPEGLYVLNVVDGHPDPRLVKSIVNTLRPVFTRVQVWLDEWPAQPWRATYVISAGGARGFPERIQARSGPAREWWDVTETLASTGTPPSALPVLTDDRVPVERLLSSLALSTLGR